MGLVILAGWSSTVTRVQHQASPPAGVGGPVGGVPLVGDGGSLGEVGGGLVVAAEEEG
jgi:hypothetical protein